MLVGVASWKRCGRRIADGKGPTSVSLAHYSHFGQVLGGLVSQTFGNVWMRVSDVEVLTKSMDCIQKTAASILDGIQAQLAATESKEVAA